MTWQRVTYLRQGLGRVADARKIRDSSDMIFRIGQHVFVAQEQHVLWVCVGRPPPLENVVEPRTVVAPMLKNGTAPPNRFAVLRRVNEGYTEQNALRLYRAIITVVKTDVGTTVA